MEPAQAQTLTLIQAALNERAVSRTFDRATVCGFPPRRVNCFRTVRVNYPLLATSEDSTDADWRKFAAPTWPGPPNEELEFRNCIVGSIGGEFLGRGKHGSASAGRGATRL